MAMGLQEMGVHHLLWKRRLKLCLDFQQAQTNIDIVAPLDCELGKWLYNHGLKNYGTMPEVLSLVKLHGEFHELFVQILTDVRGQNIEKGRKEYVRLDELSRNIVDLLTKILIKVDAP